MKWIEDVIAERELGLQAGALSQGMITWQPRGIDCSIWSRNGGTVLCEDEELAGEIIEELTQAKTTDHLEMFRRLERIVQSRLGDVQCDMYHLLYNASSVGDDWTPNEQVISIPVEEIFTEPQEGRLALGIRDGLLILSHASALPKYEVNGRKFYWMGVATHPDYRRRGLARTCVKAMHKYMGANSVAVWHCHGSNMRSFYLAESTGFVPFSVTFAWNMKQ